MTDVLIPTDPHAANPFMDPNVPTGLFQSRFFALPNPDDARAKGLYDWAIQARLGDPQNPTMLQAVREQMSDEVRENFYAYLIKQEGFIQYVYDHILIEEWDLSDPILYAEVDRLLHKPEEWPKRHTASVSIHKQVQEEGPLHVDDPSRDGAQLFLGCSAEMSTGMNTGWHIPILHSSVEPLIGPDGQPMSVSEHPPPGTWYAWSAKRAAHYMPEMSEKNLDEWGGQRHLVTIPVDFNSLVRQAIRNIEDRTAALGESGAESLAPTSSPQAADFAI